jgi:hypothetical protein
MNNNYIFRKRLFFKVIFALIFLMASFSSFAMTVQFFADDAHPVVISDVDKSSENLKSTEDDLKIDYYNLDALQAITNKMNLAIQGQDKTMAVQQVKIMMAQDKSGLTQAAHGRAYASQYGITEIPTIVFDEGLYQIKGQPDLRVAIDEYQAWKKDNLRK